MFEVRCRSGTARADTKGLGKPIVHAIRDRGPDRISRWFAVGPERKKEALFEDDRVWPETFSLKPAF